MNIFFTLLCLCFLFSCVNKKANIQNIFKKNQCDLSAVILKNDEIVFDELEGNILAHISSGSPIYLCEQKNNYTKIIFPKNNKKATCATEKDFHCSIGFIKGNPDIELLGSIEGNYCPAA